LVPTPLGTTLVQVYEDLGIELYKPYLRAQMEADMRLIAEGVKTRKLIQDESINAIQELFMKIANQPEKF
jgi:DNA topoisomerase III